MAALIALLLPRRRAYSALACSETCLATARLSASPRIRGLLQARIAISGVSPCSTTCPGRTGSKGEAAVGTRRRRRRDGADVSTNLLSQKHGKTFNNQTVNLFTKHTASSRVRSRFPPPPLLVEAMAMPCDAGGGPSSSYLPEQITKNTWLVWVPVGHPRIGQLV